MLLNNVPFTIVGVAAPEFFGMYPGSAIDLYLPTRSHAALEARPGSDPNARYIGKIDSGFSQSDAFVRM